MKIKEIAISTGTNTLKKHLQQQLKIVGGLGGGKRCFARILPLLLSERWLSGKTKHAWLDRIMAILCRWPIVCFLSVFGNWIDVLSMQYQCINLSSMYYQCNINVTMHYECNIQHYTHFWTDMLIRAIIAVTIGWDVKINCDPVHWGGI